MRARWLGTALVAGAALLALGGSPARAGAPRVEAQAWARTGAVTTFTPQPDRIYVVASVGTEEARAFVRMATSNLSDHTGATSALVLHPADDAVLPERAAVRACLLAAPFEGDGQLDDAAPPVDCGTSTLATRTDDGSWRVPLAVFARQWLARANNGLALLPELEATGSTFRLAFDTTKTTVDAPMASVPVTATPARPAVAADTEPATPATTLVTAPPPVLVDAAPSTTAPDLGTNAAMASPILATPPVDRAFAPPAYLALVAFVVAGGLTVLARTRGVALAGASATSTWLSQLRPTSSRRAGTGSRARSTGDGLRLAATATIVVLALLPLTASELTVYRATLIPIYVIAVFGLHVLVNWAGELSLAHASMVAVPAFSVLALSATHGISPLLLLPLAVVVGMALGLIVSLPALKVRGVQVAIVTLAAGVAVNQFLLTKPWLVGPLEGYDAATPSLGPLRFESNRAVYPVILLVTAGALGIGWALLHSRVARAMFWVRTDPDAASAFGISVARYRMLAFTIAGAFGGLAGGMTVVAVGRLTPGSFPATLSFAYLVPVILVGPGFAGGIVAVAILLQGGPLFVSGVGRAVQYLGPIALVISITRYRAGLHGAGRSLMERLDMSRHATEERGRTTVRVELLSAIAAACIVAGLVAIAISWYRSGNTDQVWIQNQELLSGGVGGLALVVIGTGVLVSDRIVRSHRQLIDELRNFGATEPPPAVEPLDATPARRSSPRRQLTGVERRGA